MKKNTIHLLVICFIILIPISTYFLITHLSDTKLSSLEKYTILDDEKIINEFSYDNKNYLITMFYDNTSTSSHVNIILKNKSERLLITTIRECDSSESNTYVLDNKIYIHCLGKPADIREYTLDDYKVTHKILEFDYKKTPNLSQNHILIDKIDKDNIYLYSHVTIDNKKQNKIKCSLETKKCEYIK